MRVNIITRGTQGVDMKSNPLTLENRKFHSASNIIFEEGNIRSRYGIDYTPTGALGQFQGAGEFMPARGISSSSFAADTLSKVVVADGKIHVGCDVVGDEFSCQGDVHIYQAENHLIFQNKNTSTFWWNGTELKESPGMQEQHWDDPEPQRTEIPFIPPVAEISDCSVPGPVILINYTVVDKATGLPLAGVVWKVIYTDETIYSGVTDENGQFSFTPYPRFYYVSLSKELYDTKNSLRMDFRYSRQLLETMRLTPDIPEPPDPPDPPLECYQNLIGFLTVPNGSYSLSDFFLNPVVTPGVTAEWMLRSDGVGVDSIYAAGSISDSGFLQIDFPNPGVAYLDIATFEFVSNYPYAEGVYLQLGCNVGDTAIYPPRPAIPGGAT